MRGEREIAHSDYWRPAHTLRAIEQREDAEAYAEKMLTQLQQHPSSEPAFNEEFGGAMRRFLSASREFHNRTE
jgi:hypothetical protein